MSPLSVLLVVICLVIAMSGDPVSAVMLAAVYAVGRWLR